MASISKPKFNSKGERYFLIQVYKSESERYSTRWYSPIGKSEKFIERELNKYAAEFERSCNSGEVYTRKQKREADQQKAEAEAKILTVLQYAEKVFIPKKTIEVKENTRRYYKNALDNHILPYMGKMKMSDVSPAVISAFLLEEQKKENAQSTLAGIYITLNQMFKSAYLSDMIEKNPMDKVQRPKAKKTESKKQGSAFTAEEMQNILKLADNEPLQWKVYINLSYQTGCRKGELCGLKWENIHDDGTVIIKNNLLYSPALPDVGLGAGVYEETPKSGKEREVYISAEMLAMLRDLKKDYQRKAIRRNKIMQKNGGNIDFTKCRESEYVFTAKGTSLPMHPQTPTRYFKNFADKYGIEDFHPHKLRHTFASVAISNGMDVSSTSEILGHADCSTTLKMYVHSNRETKRKTAEAVHNALKMA